MFYTKTSNSTTQLNKNPCEQKSKQANKQANKQVNTKTQVLRNKDRNTQRRKQTIKHTSEPSTRANVEQVIDKYNKEAAIAEVFRKNKLKENKATKTTETKQENKQAYKEANT